MPIRQSIHQRFLLLHSGQALQNSGQGRLQRAPLRKPSVGATLAVALVRALVLVALLPIALSIRAQSPYFKAHSLGEDLASVKVEKAYQDREGMMWFASSEGLFRFDGVEFEQFLKADTSSQHVTAIFQGRHHRLWVGYEDGSIFFLENEKLLPWLPEEGTPGAPIVAFEEDSEGRFWVATYGEGVYFTQDLLAQHPDDPSRKIRPRLLNFNAEDDQLTGDEIYVMVKDRKGHLWLGTDGGISICSVRGAGEKSVRNITRQEGLPDNIVRELLPDHLGNFWVGTHDAGFCYYDVDNQSFILPLREWALGPVIRLELFKDREVWVGTEGQGIWRYSLHDRSLSQLERGEGQKTGKVYDLYKDIEGNIWVLDNNGVAHANRQFEYLDTPFDNVQALLTDQRNQLWLGTERGVFSQRIGQAGRPEWRQHLRHLPLNVISIFEDRYGNLWLGTFGEGVWLYQPRTGKSRHLGEWDGLPNGSILSIAGTEDKVWLATLGGAVEFTLSEDPLPSHKTITHQTFYQESGLGANYIYKVLIDAKGRTWFATDGNGISVLENGKIRNYNTALLPPAEQDGPQREVPLKAIYSLAEDSRGHIWFSTAKEGIFEFDGKSFQQLAVKQGIRNLAISSLSSTEKGEILIVHSKGLDLLDPSSKHLIYYGKEVGVERMNPHLNAVSEDRYGNIWIGSQRKVIRYTPLREPLSIHPRTLLNSISVFLETVDYQHKNSFAHDENNLVFHYTGLWYTDPAAVQYRYQLEGFNPDWVTSKDRRATYPNLPPGKYTFRVTSTENAAYSDEPIVSYAFEVKPPIWRRWWFVLMALAAAGGLLWWYVRERERRIERESLLKKEKIERQFEVLKAQINPHFLFNSFNTLISLIEEQPGMAVKYVEHLSDFYRSILQFREKDLIPIAEEGKVLESFAYLLRKRFGDNLQLDIALGTCPTGALIAPLTLQMLLENAVKHNVISKTKPLLVRIFCTAEGFLVVENRMQPKMDKPESTRFGLQSIMTRYELLSEKKVIVERSEEVFRVQVPIIPANGGVIAN